jgi:hypothetical protein
MPPTIWHVSIDANHISGGCLKKCSLWFAWILMKTEPLEKTSVATHGCGRYDLSDSKSVTGCSPSAIASWEPPSSERLRTQRTHQVMALGAEGDFSNVPMATRLIWAVHFTFEICAATERGGELLHQDSCCRGKKEQSMLGEPCWPLCRIKMEIDRIHMEPIRISSFTAF